MIYWLVKKVKAYQQLESRILDLERHFALERDDAGKVTKTLADVPLEEREALRKKYQIRGTSWPQRRQWLERTDGGRRA